MTEVVDCNLANIVNIPTIRCDAVRALSGDISGGPPSGSMVDLSTPGGSPGLAIFLGDGVGGVTQRWDFFINPSNQLIIQDNTGGSIQCMRVNGTTGIMEQQLRPFVNGLETNQGAMAPNTRINFTKIPYNGYFTIATSNRFTAQVAAVYWVSWHSFADNAQPTVTHSLNVYKNGIGGYGNVRSYQSDRRDDSIAASDWGPMLAMSFMIDLQVGDYFEINAQVNLMHYHGNDNHHLTIIPVA